MYPFFPPTQTAQVLGAVSRKQFQFLAGVSSFFLCCFSSHPITMMFLWGKSLFSRALFFVLGLRATRQFIGYGFLMISRPLFHSAFRFCPLFFLHEERPFY